MTEARLHGEWRGPADLDSPRRRLVEEIWVESPLGDGWLAAFRLVPQGGEAVVAELRVFPHEGRKKRPPGQWSAHRLGLDAEAPPGGLTARVVRRVSFDEARSVLDDALRKLFDKHGSASPLPPLDPFLAGIEIDELAIQANRRPGSAGRPDQFYAAVAAQYLATARSGAPRPVQELARMLRRPPGHVRQLLATARDRGLLTGGSRGRAGGELTEKGQAALAGSLLGQS